MTLDHCGVQVRWKREPPGERVQRPRRAPQRQLPDASASAPVVPVASRSRRPPLGERTEKGTRAPERLERVPLVLAASVADREVQPLSIIIRRIDHHDHGVIHCTFSPCRVRQRDRFSPAPGCILSHAENAPDRSGSATRLSGQDRSVIVAVLES